jgi:hypothetical protein
LAGVCASRCTEVRQKDGADASSAHTRVGGFPPTAHAPDCRSVRITLTAAGRDLVAEATRRRRAELTRLLAALPPGQHEPVIAAFRAFAAAAGELPQPGAALGWAGP